VISTSFTAAEGVETEGVETEGTETEGTETEGVVEGCGAVLEQAPRINATDSKRALTP
jgi:hypothetical protein